MTALGADLGGIEAKIKEIAKVGNTPPTNAQRPYTSRAKKALELAMICAREAGRSPVSAEHLLIGLIREEKGIAAQVLLHSGVTLSQAATALDSVAGLNEGDAHEPPSH